MKRVAIIGVGLIGGSLGMALKHGMARTRYHITGLGRNPAKLRLAKRLKAIDDFYTDWAGGVKDADIVVICTPVDLTAAIVKRISPHLKPTAIITDAGSVKEEVIKRVNSVLRKKIRAHTGSRIFLGGHPMAGSEKGGIRAANRNLYKNAKVVLTNRYETPVSVYNRIKRMWKDAGAEIVSMNSRKHDKITANISHLPHIIAFNLCKLINNLNKREPLTSRLLAGSFKDLTRIADSNSRDWAAICNFNKRELTQAIESFIRELSKEKSRLSNLNRLEKEFLKARTARQKLLNSQN